MFLTHPGPPKLILCSKWYIWVHLAHYLKSSKTDDFWWFFKLSSKSRILFSPSKHIESSMFEAIKKWFGAHSTILIYQLVMGDPHILVKIAFYTALIPKWQENDDFRWFLKLSLKFQIFFWLSNTIESSIYEVFKKQFGIHNTVLTSLVVMRNPSIMVKLAIQYKTLSPT